MPAVILDLTKTEPDAPAPGSEPQVFVELDSQGIPKAVERTEMLTLTKGDVLDLDLDEGADDPNDYPPHTPCLVWPC